MKKYKLANKNQARAFVFYQLKEAFRHIDDVIGCLEDVSAVCRDFDISNDSMLENFHYFYNRVKPLQSLGEKFDVWVEVQNTESLEDLKL